jgi:TonB-dependent receptor
MRSAPRDIGKFPDTNLAESLQRITGISIERRDGEGAQVTARGFGPQFNMVTLNGRQIPGADAFGAAGPGGHRRRRRRHALRSTSRSWRPRRSVPLEVYKTSQANVPSGGIGATINIQTDKPFNHTGLVASAGAKAVSDESQPFDTTSPPEVSGIFSWTNDDKTFGVGMSASYQKRHGGSVQATENYWNIQPWTGTMPGWPCVVNAPAVGELYAQPERPALRLRRFDASASTARRGAVRAKRQPDLHPRLHLLDQRDRRESRRAEHVVAEQPTYTDIEFDTSARLHTPIYLREIAGHQGLRPGTAAQHAEVQAGLAGLQRALGLSASDFQPELRRAQAPRPRACPTTR